MNAVRSLRLSVRLLTGAIAAAAIAAIAIPADGAAAPGWRIVKVLKYCGNGSLVGVTSTGPGNAWAVGKPYANAKSCWADVEHWNGHYWKRVPVPSGLALGVLVDPLTVPIAASSATDAWIFPVQLGRNLLVYKLALHWDGKNWRRFRLPASMVVEYAVAAGPRAAWAFGYVFGRDYTTSPYAVRYDGRSWRQVRVPGEPESVSSVAPDDIWAVGPTVKTASALPAKQAIIAMRWTGHSWRTIRVPLPRASRGNGNSTSVGVAAVGPSEAWFSYLIKNERNATLGAGLLYWNGVRWQQVKAPAAISDIDAVSQDGNGGVWLLADDLVAFQLNQYWYHYTDGRWTRTLVPTPKGYTDEMFGLAWVPGTTWMWSVGEADKDYGFGTLGVITRYGG
jgi:hypothetical protein